MRIRQKRRIVFFSMENTKNGQWAEIQILERECGFSLDFLPFGPSVLNGARSKAVLRGEGYRGHRFGRVPTIPRGRGLLLLVLFFS